MLLLLALLSCEGSVTVTFPTCTVALLGASPLELLPGEVLTLTAQPLTELWDSRVTVGGLSAPLLSVDREGCDDCDDCRDTLDCDPCGADCDGCDALCVETCVETVQVTVPQLPAGPARVALFNAEGGSNTLEILVLAPEDTGGADSGGSDSGGSDSGGSDSGGSDSGGSDSGGSDSGGSDSGADTADPPPPFAPAICAP